MRSWTQVRYCDASPSLLCSFSSGKGRAESDVIAHPSWTASIPRKRSWRGGGAINDAYPYDLIPLQAELPIT